MRYEFIRPWLFALDAETSHDLSITALRQFPGLAKLAFGQCPAASPRTVMGLQFPNAVGLAAGLDKNGDCIDGMAAMGFGFIEVGTVTPRPQPGNARPRLFRLPEHKALINRLGFNNKGVDHLVRRIAEARYSGILGVNIGKNFDTPLAQAADDYLACLKKVYPMASYVTVNISSPNTSGLRELQSQDSLDSLLEKLKGAQNSLAQQHGKYVPLAVKIAPDLSGGQISEIADVLRRHQMDAVIATNTTVSREAVEGSRHADEAGGLSGRPLRNLSTHVIRELASRLGNELPIIGVGGIIEGKDAREKMQVGASLVQVYTGFIYRGPALIGDCIAALR